MKARKIFEQSDYVLYRNTSIEWFKTFKQNKVIEGKPFISFSFDSNSGGMDNFGDTQIVFDADKLFSQGAIEIIYEPDFFAEHPDICLYVTGYESEEDYYEQHDDFNNAEEAWENHELAWEDVIEDYAHEEEVVIKTLTYENGLILNEWDL